MIRHMKLLGGALLTAALVACGGGGGSAGTTTGGTGGTTGSTPPPTPVAVEVFTSTPELSSASSSSLSFTVVAKDANNVAIPNQTVTFAASSGNLAGALPSPATGAAGEAITKVSLSPGADRSNRDIKVTVKAGGATKEITVPVTGTAVSLSGNGSIVLGGTTSFTVKAVDSAGTPIPSAAITVTSTLGNSLSAASITTNSQGVGTFIYTGSRAGSDKITATGLGANFSSNILVSADQFSFEGPAAESTINVGATQTVVVRYQKSGAAVVGQTVSFSTTRGSITPTAVLTDSAGRATATLSSNSSGPANVVAQVTSAQVNLPVVFVARNAASLVLQANPGAVPPNTGTSTTNQAGIQATVRDAAGNPVAGQTVNFTAITDGSNGVLSPGTAVTDSSGTASVQFIPGPLSTANNGVVIQASVQGTAITGQASLTVNAQALFIAIATGNVVSNLNVTTYEKEFSVYVTDANGAPAANRVVNLSYFPDSFGKGTLAFSVPAGLWVYSSLTACPNEDVNRNGILNAGEDVDGNGRLYPGIPVVVSPASVTTGANGFATFKLQYGENMVPWIFGTITARASVGGTESVRSQVYNIEGLASDFSSASNAPAGIVSPFGTATTCTDPN